MLKRLNRDQRGLTLVELLVVVAILGVLAGIVTFGVVGLLANARTRAAAQELEIVQSATDTMMADKGVTSVTEVTVATNDMTAFPDATNALNPNYLRDTTTKGTYTCTTDGTVTQATTGY